MKLSLLIKFIRNVNIWKTVYFNFYYFPLKIAIRFPFLIYYRSLLCKMGGQIIIKAPVKTGMVKWGAHYVKIHDPYYSRTIWDVEGTLVINGQTTIGRGCKINIEKGGQLILGDNFLVTGNSSIICEKEISFGDDCMLSWDILMMDTDYHHIHNSVGEKINYPKPIHIGNHVWIGCKNTILKGVTIGDNNVVAANSTITHSVYDSNCIVGGSGKSVEVLKNDISWHI